jgi:hypothetical protein
MRSRRASRNTSPPLTMAGTSISARASSTAGVVPSSGWATTVASASWSQPSGGWSYQNV